MFFVVAALAAYILLEKKSKQNLDAKTLQKIPMLFVVCYIGGYLGARLFSIFVDQRIFAPLAVLSELMHFGPMTFFGGAVGAFGFGALYAKWGNMPVLKIFDLAMPCGMFALAIGRLGCFLNGDDYGIVVDSGALGWLTPAIPALGDELLRVPVQVLSSLAAFSVGLFFWKKTIGASGTYRGRPGLWGTICVASYCVVRFFLEFLRGDPRGSVGPLSTSQVVSLVLLIGCVIFVFYGLPQKDKESMS